MRYKFIFILFILVCAGQLISCEKKYYSKMSSTKVNLQKFIKDSFGAEQYVLLDSMEKIDYKQLSLYVSIEALIAQQTQKDFSNQLYAYKPGPRKVEFIDQLINIEMKLLSDYNNNYKAGDDIMPILTNNVSNNKAELLHHFNNGTFYSNDNVVNGVTFYLNEPPSDTTDFAVKLIITDEANAKYENESFIIRAY